MEGTRRDLEEEEEEEEEGDGRSLQNDAATHIRTLAAVDGSHRRQNRNGVAVVVAEEEVVVVEVNGMMRTIGRAKVIAHGSPRRVRETGARRMRGATEEDQVGCRRRLLDLWVGTLPAPITSITISITRPQMKTDGGQTARPCTPAEEVIPRILPRRVSMASPTVDDRSTLQRLSIAGNNSCTTCFRRMCRVEEVALPLLFLVVVLLPLLLVEEFPRRRP